MEYKVRLESHSVLEKMFSSHSKSGIVTTEVIPTLLREFNEDIEVSSDDIGHQLSEIGDVGEGLDFENFEKVMVHFLAKQSRKESNDFGHKNVISLADFDTP